MPLKPFARYRRWVVVGPGVAASLLPALVLTATWESHDRYASTFLAFWVELVVGPPKYWLPVLLGQPRPDGLHPIPGISTWVYAVCLPLTLLHPLWPRLLTGCVTAAAFGVWYFWAWGILNSFEF